MRGLLKILVLWISVQGPSVWALVDSWNTPKQTLPEPQLRWDNIEGAPYWVAGVSPTFDLWQSRHVVILGPSQSVTVRLPSHEMLRLERKDHLLRPHDVQVELSNGSGCFLATTEIIPAERGDALLVPQDAAYPQLVRVSNLNAYDTLTLSVFVSRHLIPKEYFPYRDVVDLSSPERPRRVVANRERGEAEDFWALRAGAPVRTRLRGWTRYALETRFAYPVTESRLPQTHYVTVKVNGVHWTDLEYVTSAETVSVISIDQTPHAVGRLERAFLDLPPSDEIMEVEFIPIVPVLGRLLELESTGYLFPRWNAPDISVPMMGHRETPLWELSEQCLSDTIQYGAPSPLDAERVALRLVRDNSRKDGALLATMLLRREAEQRHDMRDLRKLAAAIRGNHTFYRDVLPTIKVSPDPQEYAYFRPCRLKSIDRPQAWRLGSSQHTFALTERLPGALFNTVPRDGEGLDYRFNERAFPTEIRLTVSQETLSHTAQLAVQFDDGPFLRLHVDPDRRLPEAEFAPNQGELGLEMLRRRFPGHHLDTLDVPFSQGRRSGRLLRAAYVEFPIGPSVKRLRLISLAGKGEQLDVRVAVQIRSAKPFQLSETEYYGIINRLKCQPHELFARRLENPDWCPHDRAERELLNHWEPLVRYIRSRHDRIAASVSPWEPSVWTGRPPSEDSPVTAQERLEWLSAKIALEESLDQRYAREIERALLLHEIGDEFLAERQFQGLVLFAEEKASRDRAVAELERLYRLENDNAALDTLFAMACVRDPSVESMVRLVEHLGKLGQWDLCLQLNLILPEPALEPEATLVAALPNRWWGTYEKALIRLPDEADRSLWYAHRAWMQGRQREATHAYSVAGAGGKPMLAYLRETWAIRRQLLAGNEAEKADAVLAWARLERDLPGETTWQRDDGHVRDYERGITLESVERNTFYRGFTSEVVAKPVTLRFTGPLSIELECRPLHDGEGMEALEGWLRVVERGKRRLMHTVPVINNRVTKGLRAVGLPGVRLGRKVSYQMDFGPGVHEIAVSSAEFDVVVSVSVSVAAVRMSYLPPISGETMRALTQSVSAQRERLSWRSVALEYVLSGQAMDTQLTAIHDFHSNLSAPWNPHGEAQVTALCLSLKAQMRCSFDQLSIAERRARFLLDGELEKALGLPWDRDVPLDVEHRARLYKWVGDSDPIRATAMMVALAELQSESSGLAEVRLLQDSLGRAFDWERVASVETSAGSREVEVAGWKPEVEALLRRSALTGVPLTEDHVATSGEEMSVVVTLPDPSEVRVEARLLDMPYLTTSTVDVAIQLPGEEVKRFPLRAGGGAAQMEFRVEPGKHTVRAVMENAVPNQYLAVRILTRSGYDEANAWEPLTREQRRSCFIATAEEPVSLSVAGPTWLRIDDWSGGEISTRYEAIHEAMQLVTLSPAEGSDEALYRIQRLVHRPNEERSNLVRAPSREPVPVVGPVATMPTQQAPQMVIFDDQYTLGWQENGTPSLTLRGVSRRSADEDTETLTDTERFLEFSGSYRKYHPHWRTYSHWKHFARLREYGGPTVGWENRLDWYPDDRPYHVYFLSRLLMQDPDGESLLSGGNREWSLYGRAGISVPRRLSPQFYHVPSITVFGRALSLKDNEGYEKRKIDQDIFTPYKADHRYGVQASESVHWKPWQDTDLYGGVSVGSNEDFNLFKPDHAKAWIGWRQQLGSWQTDLRFRNTQYFADSDRRRDSSRNALSLAVNGEHWFSNQTRLEYGVNMTHYFEDNARAFGFFLTWHFGEGRAYRDFRPGEIPFRRIRERRVPLETNNHLWLSHVVPPSK